MYRKITLFLVCLLFISLNSTQAYHVDETFRTLSGNDVPLSSFEGKPMILEAIQTTCPACNDEGHRNNLNYLYSLYEGDVNFLMLTVRSQDTANDMENFVSQHSIEFTAGLDNKNILPSTYGVESTPTTLLLDTDGTMERKWVGHQSVDVYIDAINKLVETERTVDEDYTGDAGGNSGPSIIEQVFTSPIFQFSFVGFLILVIYFKSTASAGTKID